MEEKKSGNIIGVILLILAAVFCAAVFLLPVSCPVQADGSWMECHWALQALKGVAASLVLLALLGLLLPGKGVKAGLYIGMLVNAALVAAIPYYLFGICRGFDMQCTKFLKPGSLYGAAVFAVLALLNAIILSVGSRSDTKRKINAAKEQVEKEARAREARAVEAQVNAVIPEKETENIKAPWEKDEYK